MSLVSTVMVTYHTGPSLWAAMESVLRQPECGQLILVNNGNVPGVEAQLTAFAAREPKLVYVTGHGNIGFGRACNLGAKQATADYLLLLNPDCMLPDGAFFRMLRAAQDWPEKTVAGCFLANPDGSEQRGGRRAILTPENAISESLGLHRFFKNAARLNFNETDMPDHTHEVPAISGAFMFLRRSFYEELRGIDESYFLHMEDMDFCYRARKAGGTIVCVPDVKTLHFKSTSEVASKFIEKWKARGFIRYLRTHFSGQCSERYLKLLEIGIWTRYGLKCISATVDKMFTSPLAGKQEVARMAWMYILSGFQHIDTSLEGRTIVVTGASGQVGLCVVARALARGANVIGIYNSTEIMFSHPRLTWVQCDLTDPDADVSAMNCDALIHTASLWMLPPVLTKFIDAGIPRIVAFSSTSVVGKSESKNEHEQEVVAKLLAAEEGSLRIANDRQRRLTIFRPTMIYGVGLDGNISRMADVIRRFGFVPVYGGGTGIRHPVQAQDLADAALDVLDNAKTYGKTYNLGGAESLTYREMVEKIFAYLGKKPKIIHPPMLPIILDILGKTYQLRQVNGEMAHRMNRDLLFDPGEAVQDFDYQPHGFLEGIVTI